MKKIVSIILVLCMMVAFLPVMAVPAQASGENPEKSLQHIYYFDYGAGEILDESTTGVLVKNGSSNLVFTIFPSRESEDIYIAATTENDSAIVGFFSQTWNEILYMYEAESQYGEAEGFTEIGTVEKDESVYLVLGWDSEGNKGGYQTTAAEYEDGLIILKEELGEWEYPIPVLNSKNEVCAIYYDEYCFSLITDEETFYANSKPDETPEPTPTPDETPNPTPTPDETPNPTPTPNETPEETPDKSEVYGLPVELPDLDDIYDNAVIQKKSSNMNGVVLGCIGAVIVFLLAAVVIVVKKKSKQKDNADLNEAEEGTQLADEPDALSLYLQFRSGQRIAVRCSLTIGRAPDNTVVIPRTSTSVSGHHCEIVVSNGAVYLRDIGSMNGTFVNGRRIAASQLVPLQPGMNVNLGGAEKSESFIVMSNHR